MSDTLRFWFIIVLSILSVYFLPGVFSLLFFFAIAFYTIRNQNYSFLFVALWFFFIDAPGDLYLGESLQDHRQLPVFSIPGGGFVSLRELVPLILLIAILLKNRKIIVYRLDSNLKFLFTLFVLVSFYSIFLGFSANAIFNTILILFKLSLFYTIPRIIDHDSIYKLDRLLFSVVIFAFVTQIITLLTGMRLVDFVKGTEVSVADNYLMISSDRAARVFNSPFISTYVLFKALSYTLENNTLIKKQYISLVISLTSIMIFLSATRGWILAWVFSFILIFLIFNRYGSFKRIFRMAFVLVGFVALIQLAVPIISLQFDNSLERFLTVTTLAEGDISMGGDLYRVTDRAPKLLKVFYENPVFGWGFSNVYWQNRDLHVGQINILMNLGIVGALALYITFLLITYKMFSLKTSNGNNINISGSIFGVGLIFVMIIHSTSHQFWGYDLEIGPTFFLAMLISSWQLVSRDLNSKSDEREKILHRTI